MICGLWNITLCVTDQLRNAVFVKTAEQGNHLDPSVVHAETVEGFKTHLPQFYCFNTALSPSVKR